MATHEDVLKEMEIIFRDKLILNLEEPLTFETDLIKDLGLDSIMFLELIVELEVKYELEIDEEELKGEIFSKIGNFIDLIAAKIQQKESSEYAIK